MNGRQILKYTGIGIAAGAALSVAGYAATVVFNRTRYGGAQGLADPGFDSLLDRFIPEPEVVEHHHIAINAPADVVMSAAKEMELLDSPVVRAIIRARELTLGGEPDARPHPPGLLAQMLSIGWVVLSERAGREIVLGAVTQPWEARPVFRSIPAGQFREFSEPGFVKIAWTLRADPVDERHSIFHTETRVCTTDTTAREHFRSYWSFVAPGVRLIRLAMLRPLRRAAERRLGRRAA
ncbi:MAG TPA: hypothetical protein VNT81_07945 [Vicinamibacterales bacterium]|nr:hypothetical protein [Vicinamibacterales bacterium]